MAGMEPDPRNQPAEQDNTARNQSALVSVLAMMEQNRHQAEMNQARLMEHHLRLLEQIAIRTASSSSSAGATLNREGAQVTSRWTDFQKARPTFSTLPDPLAVKDRLRDVERKLRTVQCDEREKVLYASHKFQGQAANFQIMHEDGEISWKEFEESFRQAHIPDSVIQAKRREFLALKQGERSIMEYLHKFNQLACYAPDDVKTEAKKMERFREGLQKSLKYHISAMKFKDLLDMVNKLITSEEARNEMEESRKRKAMQRPTSSSSAQRGRTLVSPQNRQQSTRQVILVPRTQYNAPQQGVGSQPLMIWCHTCGGNHYQRNCPQKMNACYHCGQVGHYRDQCPKKGLPSEVAKLQTRAQQLDVKPIIITPVPRGYLQTRPSAPKPTAPAGITVGMPAGSSAGMSAGRGRGTASPTFQARVNHISAEDAAGANDVILSISPRRQFKVQIQAPKFTSS